jgi:hypothetical protein
LEDKNPINRTKITQNQIQLPLMGWVHFLTGFGENGAVHSSHPLRFEMLYYRKKVENQGNRK